MGSGKVHPFLDLLQQADPDLLRTLEQVIRDGAGFNPGMFDAPDAVELFAEYLDFCEARVAGNESEMEQFDRFPDLVCALSDLSIRSNGGDHLAREDIAEIDVGNDIASGTALDKIPLMQHVARQIVRSFEARL
jgi:hypothetical protein